MIRRRVLAPVLLGAFGLTAMPSAAGAAVSCSFNAATAKVSVVLGAASDVATLKRSGSSIRANGVACGTATTANTNLIRVDGTIDSSQGVIVDLTGGAFAPGKTAETGTGNVSEIEMQVDMRSGYNERLTILGATTADNIVFGTAGGNLNGDTDIDLTHSGVDAMTLTGDAGADTLSIGGNTLTGDPVNVPALMDGGAAADTVTGGRQADKIQGGSTDVAVDTLRGGTGGDELRGGPGNDLVYGDAGFDYLEGDLGDDTLEGGADGDNFSYYATGSAADGKDIVRGGTGSDRMYYGTRNNNVLVSLDGVANDGLDVAADGVAEEADNIGGDVEYVQGGSGNDVIDARFPSARLIAHNFDGRSGDDKLYGGDLEDSLYGQDGIDRLEGGPAGDYMVAGVGNDTLLGGDDDDDLYPDAGNDTVLASNGDDYIDAGNAASGADSYSGGTGYDRISYSSRSDNLDVILDNLANDGTDVDGTLGGEEGDNVRADIERFDLGSGNDFLDIATTAANAVAADNTIYLGQGDDVVNSGPGQDYVDGTGGADKITGGPGEDTVYGGAGADVFTMNDSFTDFIDGGSGDAVTDTGTFDSFDQKVNFP